MSKLSVLVFALLSLTSPIIASTATLETCITKQGTSSVAHVPTSTYAVTLSLTAVQKMTTTPVKTITPAVSSTTTTSTSTSVKTITAKGSTTVYTTTSTVPVTNTVTGSSITSSVVVTSTITSTTDTYTVPTASGFTPIASESGYVPKKRSFVPRGHKDMQPAKRADNGGVKLAINNGDPTCSPALYPTAVTCGEVVEQVTTSTVVATAAPRTTTVPASTTTITKSASVTTTSIVGARSTSVVTSSATTTKTVFPTTSISSTSTVTYISAASTVYAACATDNAVSVANGGQQILTTGSSPGAIADFNTVDNIDNAYDCCVACVTSLGNCGGYNFSPGYCSITTFDSCNPDFFGSEFESEFTSIVGFTIGNGPCGQVLNGGTL